MRMAESVNVGYKSDTFTFYLNTSTQWDRIALIIPQASFDE